MLIHRLNRRLGRTFALQALTEEAFEQLLAVLADGGASVRVDYKRVRDFHFGQQDLVQLDGPADVRLRVGPSSAREDV